MEHFPWISLISGLGLIMIGFFIGWTGRGEKDRRDRWESDIAVKEAERILNKEA